jgi:oligoendopeptidase F
MSNADAVPPDLDATQWSNLRPLYESLQQRELKCQACLERLILDRSELDAAVREAAAVLYINMTCHTDDAPSKKAYLYFVEGVEPELRRAGFELDKKIAKSPHASKLDRARYEVLLRDLRTDVELFRDENVPLMTEDTKLGQQYSEICGAMMVEFRGREHTLPQMAKYLEETDRATREEAWRLVAERRFRDHEKLSDIFDEMIRIRHQIALNAGFANYRDYMFKAKHRFDYTPADCEAFHRGAEQVCVPLYRQLNRERAEALKIGVLRPWDLDVDVKGREPLRPFDHADQLVEGSSRIFHRIDGSLGAMFDTLRDGTSLDLESRKGKAPGGYQQHRDRSRKPFIFMNAAGRHDDLQTMLHEAGHAFHAILSKDEPLLHYRHAPLEFAEVASMGMELLAQPYLDEFYAEPEAERARRSHLEELVRLVPWVARIDAFQHWIYTNPTHTRAQRTATWRELETRFGAEIDWSGFESHRDMNWQRQLHLFEVPFYYIEYGIAQLGALQLWLHARRNERTTLQNYQRALALGGSRPIPQLFGAAELEFKFGPEVMKSLFDEVRGELAALPE